MKNTTCLTGALLASCGLLAFGIGLPDPPAMHCARPKAMDLKIARACADRGKCANMVWPAA